MASEVDIRARLTLDDKASAAVGKVRDAFKQAGESAAKATDSGMGFMKQIAATAIGMNIGSVAKGVGEMTFGWLKSAAAAQDSNRAMAATFATMQNIPFESAAKRAGDLKRELTTMALDVGVSSKSVNAGLQVMLETMGAGEKQVGQIKRQMGELALVAKIMGRPVEDVAREFSFMHEGMLRAKGQFTLMLSKTGIFGDDIRKGVAAFKELSAEERAAKLEKGLSMLSSRMKDFPKTTSDIATSYENLLGMMKGTFATPIIKAVAPVLEELANQIRQAQPELIKFTSSLGKDFGGMAKEAAKSIADGMRWAAAHAKEIKGWLGEVKDALVFAFGAVKDSVLFVMKHKEAFLAMAAAWKTTQLMGGLGAAGGGAAGAAGKGVLGLGARVAAGGGGAATGLGTMIQTAGGAGGAIATGAAVAGLAALAAAIAGVGAAAWQASKLYEETLGTQSESALDAQAKMEAAEREWQAGRIEESHRYAKEAYDLNKDAVSREMALWNSRAKEYYKSTETYNAAMEKAGPDQVKGLADAWNQAVDTGNAGMQAVIAQTVMQSAGMKAKLEQSGLQITGGMEAMSAAIQAAADRMRQEFITAGIMIASAAGAEGDVAGAERRKAMREAGKAAKDKAPSGGGGTTVNVNKMEIKQEFRNQDPDRIAVVFQRDLVKHATRRVQSKRATIFGV